MERNQEIGRILLHIILGTVFCILFGYFFYGTKIFETNRTLFQFVVSGIVGSIFYAFLKYRSVRISWISLGALLFITLLVLRVRTPLRILAIVIHFLSIGISMILYRKHIIKRLAAMRVGKFIAYSLIYAVTSAILTLIYGWIQQYPDMHTGLNVMLRIWLLTGAGLGLGLESAELIYPLRPANQEK